MDKLALHKSIIRTLALFAAQDNAATLLEISGLLVRVYPEQKRPTLAEIQAALAGPLAPKTVFDHGLYSLTSHAHTIALRREKYIHTMRLFKKARQWARVLRYMPFVRAAGISGSLAQMNGRATSDIDLFIITAPGKIFFTRLLVSAYFQIFGGRRHGKRIVGRFCLNHYITQSQRLESDHNLYTAMLYTSFIPVFGSPQLLDFWEHNLEWISEYFLLPRQSLASHAFEEGKERTSSVQRILEILLSPFVFILEPAARFLQRRRIRESEFVTVSDSELSFHPDSKGQRILGRFRDILGSDTAARA